MEIKEILEKIQNHEISIEEAEKEIKNNQYEDLGYAKIDHNRKERIGTGEVIFCQSKPDEFLSNIYKTIYKENGEVLGTRASKEQFDLVKKDEKLQIIVYLLYYILYIDNTGLYKDVLNWKMSTNLFKSSGNYMIPVIALLSGCKLHKENMIKNK